MELYVFGYQNGRQIQNNLRNPDSALRAETIRVLWSSWCDAVIACQDDTGAWTVEYRGTGLTEAQAEHVISSEAIKRALAGPAAKVDLFGTAMHDGLRGYVSFGLEHSDNEAVLFATDVEIETGVPEIQFSSSGDTRIEAVRMTSNGSVLVSVASSQTSDLRILRLKDLPELRNSLENGCFDSATPGFTSTPHLQVCTNSTTTTILSKNGQVYTATSDPRYPTCLGRPYEGNADFEPIPYLSETHISQTASGGYMTAAASTDGELFLWGQACPGAQGQLSVLKRDGASNDGQPAPMRSGVSAEDEQDDFIKCLTVRIEGQETKVYDVAVGHGHVLVAAEVHTADGSVRRAVFAAGDNGKGQLGCERAIPYLPEFEEVVALRNRKVLQLVAAGWTSYAVASVG